MTNVAPPGESEYNTGTWQKFAYYTPLLFGGPTPYLPFGISR